MKSVKCAIVGCGGYAGAHARRLSARDDVEIVALVSRTEASIENLIQRRLSACSPAPRRYTSLPALLENEALDAVVLSTPHDVHVEQAVYAIDAGWHVLIEKPMAVTLDGARRIVERAREARRDGQKLQVGVCYNPAFSPAMRVVRKSVQSGNNGKLELVTGYLAQDWLRLTSGTWRQEPETSGGGQAMDSGAHLVHSLISGVGSQPAEVFAFSSTAGGRVDINTVISVRFQNGVLASLTIGGNSAVAGTGTSFIFTKGRIDVDAWQGAWVRNYGVDREPEVIEGLEEPSPDDNFIDAILGTSDLIATEEDGLLVAAFMDALYRSVSTGLPAVVERNLL
jgi:predicted dehydrogenase